MYCLAEEIPNKWPEVWLYFSRDEFAEVFSSWINCLNVSIVGLVGYLAVFLLLFRFTAILLSFIIVWICFKALVKSIC